MTWMCSRCSAVFEDSADFGVFDPCPECEHDARPYRVLSVSPCPRKAGTCTSPDHHYGYMNTHVVLYGLTEGFGGVGGMSEAEGAWHGCFDARVGCFTLPHMTQFDEC